MASSFHPRVKTVLRALACALLAFVVASQLPALAEAAESGGQTNMYRLYNPNSGEHFYTASLDEAKSVVEAGWRWEGVGWVAPTKSNTPVYRLYSGTDHHYTTSVEERDWDVAQGWKSEGIGWYSDDAQRVPLYRQFNPNVDPSASRNNSGSHNYTMSQEENDDLVSRGWKAEGTAWYGTSAQALPIDPFTVRSNAWGGGYQEYLVDSAGKISRVKANEDTSELGERIAKVAVACAGTASPDPYIKNTGSNAPWSKVNDARLSTWYRVADATLGAFGGNEALSSCAQAVAGVLGATVDPDIAGNLSGKDAVSQPSNSPDTIWRYVREHPEMYQKVSSASDIRPGDIYFSSQHTAIYVGNEVARRKFPNSNGTVFEASYPDRYPALGSAAKDHIYSRYNGEVYHVVATNSSPKYPYVDYKALIG